MSQLYKLSGLSLAKVMTDDRAFLLQLYASSKAADMSIYGLDEAEKNAYIEKQFNAQQHYFQSQYPKGKFLVINKGVAKIGRLYLNLDRNQLEIKILDFMLMPSYRGHGIDQQLLEAVIKDAKGMNADVTIDVESEKSTLNLYQKLGFKLEEKQGRYQRMRWSDD